jgi:hypothetical protein
VIREEQGSALIWFVFLLALLFIVVMTLAASIHQFLFARELTDFTEQFALAIKTRFQFQSNSNLDTLASALIREVSSLYSFPGLQLRSISLEAGETVKVIFCAKWTSPIPSIEASRTICEAALAR